MQFGSILASAVIASMANPVLSARSPSGNAKNILACFVRKTTVVETPNGKTINAEEWRETSNPGQLEFTDGSNKITVKVDKNCQSAGITEHRDAVHFYARRKVANNGRFEPDEELINLWY